MCRSHRDHLADQAVAIQHRLLRPHSVRAADVDRDRLLQALPERDDRAASDSVATGACELQQMLELRGIGLAQLGGAQLGLQPGQLALQRGRLSARG